MGVRNNNGPATFAISSRLNIPLNKYDKETNFNNKR